MKKIDEKNYSDLLSFFDKYEKIYLKIWGKHVHYGFFPKAKKVEELSLDEVGDAYTRELLTLGLLSLPLYRRDEKDILIIELCCGRAPTYPYLVKYLKKVNMRGLYYGIDIQKKLIEECKLKYARKSGEEVTLEPIFINDTVESFLNDLSELHGNVDIVICQDSFYYIKNKLLVLKLLKDLVRPGGILLFSDVAVEEHFRESDDFINYFIRRQANSKPLTFLHNLYSFEKSLKDYGFFVTERIDNTKDLQASYTLASKNLVKHTIDISGANSGLIENFKSSFDFLKESAKRNKLQLQWWVAARKSPKEIKISKKRPILTFSINKKGFSYKKNKKNESIYPILDEMKLTIDESEYIGLVGKTGIGKTTLLNSIMGFFPIISNIKVEYNKKAAKVAMVHQEPVLFEDIRLIDAINIIFSANKNRQDISEEFNSPQKIIMQCNLRGVQGNLMQNLSRGQKQRTSIAMAIASKPDLLLLDEPLASQDYIQKIEMIGILRLLKNSSNKLSIVHVTHIWEDVEDLASRFIEITGGQLIELGEYYKEKP